MRLRLGLYASLVLLATASAVTALVTNALWPPSWRVFRARHAALVNRLAADTGPRAPLLAPALPGNAWQGYLDAQRDLLDRLPPDWRDMMRYPEATWSFPGGRPDLQPFRDAARRGRAAFPIDWTGGIDQRAPGTAILRDAVLRCLAASARVRLAARDVAGAVEDGATLLQIGADFSRVPLNFGADGRDDPFLSGEHVALPFFEEGFDILRDVVDSAAAAPVELRDVEELLARFEAQLADLGAAAEAELALGASELLSTPTDMAAGIKRQVPHEERLSNIRALAGRFYLDQESRVARMRRLHRQAWSAAGPTLVAWPFEVECPWLEWPGLTGSVVSWRDRLHRELRAAAAILRAAARFRIGIKGDSPLNPYTLLPVGRSDSTITSRFTAPRGVDEPERISGRLPVEMRVRR